MQKKGSSAKLNHPQFGLQLLDYVGSCSIPQPLRGANQGVKLCVAIFGLIRTLRTPAGVWYTHSNSCACHKEKEGVCRAERIELANQFGLVEVAEI